MSKEDAISRNELLKAIDTWDKFGVDDTNSLFRLDNLSLPHYVPYIHYDDVIKCIKGMPPVTQKSGKWIKHPEIETSAPEYLMFYECSECGDKQCFCKSDIHKKRFCNNCGAKMESEGGE
jgi:hypothetical protein